MGFPSGSAVKNQPAMQEPQKTQVQFLGGESPGGGHGNPLQYSCLEHPMDRGAWRAIVAKSCKELDMTEATEHTHTHTDTTWEV